MRIILLRIFNVVMAIVALLALLLVLGVGRLMYGPVTTAKLTPWIENALSQKQFGIRAKIGQSLLHWDSDRHQVVLDLTTVQFVDPLDQKVADIPQVLLVLKPLGYFEKEHSPWVMVVRHPQLHLRIDAQGKLRLGALQAGESNILEKDEDTTLTAEGLRDQLRGIAQSAHGAAFGLFSNFSIEDAGVTLIDEPHNEVWNLTVPLLSMKRVDADHEGTATLHIVKDKVATDIDLNVRFSAAEQLFHAVLSFKDIAPTMFSIAEAPFKVADYSTGNLSGAVTVVFNDNLDVHNGLVNLVLGEGNISAPDYFPGPLKMKKALVTAAYTSSNNTLTIEPASIELEKATLAAAVKVKFSGDARTVNTQLKLTNLRLEDLGTYWPEKMATNARVWILENMKKGLADEVTANIDVSFPGMDFSKTKVDRLDGTISLKDAEVRYWEPLPVIEHASATSKFDSHHFDIDVLGGEVAGTVKLKPSHVVITGIDAEDQIATIEAHLAGPAPDVLKILNRKPLGYADKMKVDPALVTGGMEGVIKTSFPLIKALLLDQMNITAEVKLINIGIKKIVDFLTITDGNVTLGVDVKAMTIDGEAKLNGIPAHVRWDEKFSGAKEGETLSHGVANAVTPVESAAKFGVGFSVHSDPLPVTVVYDRYPDLSKLSITADASKSVLFIPDVGYYKQANAPANIQIGLDWGGSLPPRLSKIDFSGQNLNIKGQGSFAPGGKMLAKLNLNPLVIGQTKAKLDFIRENNVPHWSLSGEALDISGFLNAPAEDKKVTDQVQADPVSDESPPPLRVDVQVGRLIAGDKAELGNTTIRGYRDKNGWAELNVATVAEQQTPFNLTIGPQGGRTVLAANTPNLGHVLNSMNVTNTLIGGKLNMDGKSEPGDALRSLFGHIKLDDFRVSDMPVLLKILSAISPDALNILGRQTLHFSDLTSEYIWSKNSFIFTKANTSTGTLGLTAAGKVDLVHNMIDLEGQVIPVEFISKIIGAIPLIGDILTGGNGHGLFAATYKVQGALNKPSVSVNPVSILAPGIIRDILFTNPNITKDTPITPAKPATTSPNPPTVH